MWRHPMYRTGAWIGRLMPASVTVCVLAASLSACSSGEEIPPPTLYVNSCMPCHGDGLGGAPITGDAEEWERRTAKGLAKVRQNAIDGLEGGTGVMPAKGGRMDVSDEEIIALVDYMLEASQ